MNGSRWICLSGLLICLLVGGYLRLRGADWGAGAPRSYRGMYAHPDERSVYDKTSRLRWEATPRQADSSRFSHWVKVYSNNFLNPQSGMNLDSYNYGSFPYYVLFGLSNLFNSAAPQQVQKNLLQFTALVYFTTFLIWALSYLLSRSRPGWEISSYKISVFLAGWTAFSVLLYGLSGVCFTLGTGGPDWSYQTWGKLARPLSGLAGTLTIFYVYRIGGRLYGRRVGLLAAILLTFTALHLQLSHYFTFDILQAFFCTAAVYALLSFVDAPSWGQRWRSMLAASIWIGLGMSTKFGSILLFIPWIVAFGLSYWRHRPKIHLFRAESILFAGNIKLIGIVSFFLIWSVSFLTQPFGYLDYPPLDPEVRPLARTEPSAPTEISFLHLNFAAGPKAIPEGIRAHLSRIGEKLDVYTGKVGIHFGWLEYHSVALKDQDWLIFGGSRYWRDVTEQRGMALEGGFPWTRQYNNTTPFLYQWKNLIYWGMGVPLGFLCLFGLFYGFLKPFYRPTWNEWVILAWMVPNFFTTHLFHTKFPRYLTPELPFFCLWGAALAVVLFAYLRSRERHRPSGLLQPSNLVAIGCVTVVAWSALYSFATVKIFTGTHTWERTSDWFQKEAKPGKHIVTETWDDAVPTDPGVMKDFEHRTSNPIHSDSPQHLRTVCEQMEWADYYCFSSKRNYGAFLQAPEDGPNRVRFYKSLFAGNLGFRLVKTFSQPVEVLGVPIRFELADESLSLYDHPTVHIFEKVEDLDSDGLLDRILHPPDWIDNLTQKQILTATEGRSLLAPPANHAMARWLIGVLLVGWLLWPITFFLFRGSLEGGIFASKTVGILMLTYLSWLGSNLGWWANTRLATSISLILWMVLSGYCIFKAGNRMKEFVRENWRRILFAEGMFLLVFAYFISVRMANPDIYWGEKPMNIAFVNAAYRAEAFPAIDPWFAGATINYYHYGHFAIGIFGKWVGVPPEYAYNLACGTWPALVFCLVFGIVFNLTRSKLGGLIGGFLATMAGNGKSVFQLAASLQGGPQDPKSFRESYVSQGLGHYLSDVLEQLSLSFGQIGPIFWRSPLFEKVGQAFGTWVDPTLLDQAKNDQLHRTLSFDGYFWKLSRITKSSVANEFPAWTHFFSDLHAHQIVMPIGMVVLALIVAFFQRKVGKWKLEGEGDFQESHRVYGSSMVCLLQTLALGLFLGIVFVSNAWDFPGLFGLFSITLMVFFLIYYPAWFLSVRWGFGRSILSLGVGGRFLQRITYFKLGLLREVFLPILTIGSLSYAFLYPFHRYFNPPKRVGGIGWMYEAASGWTTPYEFLQIFGFFFLLIVLGYVLLLWRWGTVSRLGGIGVLATLVLGAAVTYPLVRVFRELAAKSAGLVEGLPVTSNRDSLAFWRHLDADIAYVTFGGVFFLLLLAFPFILGKRSSLNTRLGALILALGLAIVAGVEVVYINENWGPPVHRWNTAFKFHLQAWICLSVGVGWLLGNWWTRSTETPTVGYRVVGRITRYGLGYPVLILTLILAAVFPMVAPFIFTYGEGFSFRTRHVDGDYTLDGLNFLRKKHPDYAAAVDFLRENTNGQPTILEVEGESYSHDRGFVATHTGLPTLMGWVHHTRERDHQPEPRIEQVTTLYTSINRERVRDILRDHRVRYVIVGPTERKIYTDIRGIEKFDSWKDLFYPVFTSKIEEPGVTLYGVHPAYQLDEDWAPPAQTQDNVSFFRPETGRPLLRGALGSGGGEYREPRGLVVTASGEVVIADSMNHRIQAFDPHGNLKWTLGEEGDQSREFKEPRDLSVDEQGRIHILDTWNSRVQVYSSTGDLVLIYSVAGGANGIAIGRIPIATATDSLQFPPNPVLGAPMTFIANTAGRNILVLNRKGEQTQSWGSGTLQEPVDVEATPQGLAVVDARLRKILWYDGRGRFLEEWEIPTEATGDQTNEFKMVWDTPRNRLLVTDPAHDRLFVYSREGKLQLDTTVRGGPSGVGVSADGRVFISAKGEGKILLVPVPIEK